MAVDGRRRIASKRFGGVTVTLRGAIAVSADGTRTMYSDFEAAMDRLYAAALAAERREERRLLVAEVKAVMSLSQPSSVATRRAEIRAAYDRLAPAEIESCATDTALFQLILNHVFQGRRQTAAALRRALAGYKGRPGTPIL